MVNYQNGKIYRILSKTGKQYVGSTTQNLAKRKSGHVRMYNAWLKNKEDINFTTSFTLFEEGDVDIVLIENYSCENKEELLRRERYWIENIEGGCVNKVIPTRTIHEYRQSNKKQILEKNKHYYQQNKDRINERDKQYYEANKKQILEKDKQYYEQNKEQILEKAKQYREINKDKLQEKTKCPCGGCFSKQNIRRHERSIIHQDYIKNIS